MSDLELKRKRRSYVTYNSRVAEIMALYHRAPTENEIHALKTLPLGRLRDWADTSPVGLKVFRLLEVSETNRDVSLLEEAGRLLFYQRQMGFEKARLPRRAPEPKRCEAQAVLEAQPPNLAAQSFFYHESQKPNDGQMACTVHDPLAVRLINENTAHSLLMVVDRLGYLPALPDVTPYPSKLVNPRGMLTTSEIIESDHRFLGIPACPALSQRLLSSEEQSFAPDG